MKEERPKIKVLPSRMATIVEIGAWVLILALAIIFNAIIGQLPDKIPVHFGADGQADRWGSPSELWVLIGIAIFVVGLLAVMRRLVAPYDMNIPIRVTAENAPRVYRLTLDLLCVLQLVIAITFSLILFTTIQTAQAQMLDSTNQLVFILIISLIFGTVGFYFIKLFSIK